MKPSGNILFGLCAVLLLAADVGRAQTVFWSDGFETNTPKRWVATGAWSIGTPTKGATKAHLGSNCALTQNYAYNQDGRIVCTNYVNGGNTLVVPDASVSPTLAYWQWVNLANAFGYVEISTNGGVTWQEIQSTLMQPPLTSGGAWLQNSFDLSPYAGQGVQIAFHFTSGNCCGNAEGWYVDDVALTILPVITVTVPPTQTVYDGQTMAVTVSATNSYLPKASYTFKLLSPPANVSINSNGVVTWTIATNQPSSTNTITVKVTDNSKPPLSATNSFMVQVLPALVLTVPPTQTNYAGQELDVTISATNYANPDDYFTFATNSPTPTNVWIDLNTGELTWTPTAAQKGPNTITITVTNNIEPFFRVTTNFVVVVSTNIPPPTLNVPLTTLTNYPGQTLIVTNTATGVFPNSIFTFATNSPPTPTGVMILVPTNGVLTWAIPTTQLAASYRISVTVTDSVSLLIATKTFVVVVSTNIPQPMLIVPPTQTNYVGQTMIVTNYAHYPNSVLPSSAFSFVLLSGPANAVLNPTNGILKWVIPMTQPVGNTNLSIMVTDCVSHLIATSNFLVQVLPPQPPTLIVPPMQLLYAGQTMDVTLSATNSVYTNCTFTFAAFGPTNLDVSNLPKNGVLKWTPLAAQAALSPNTIYVQVTDNNSLSAISNFLVLVFATPQPGFTVSPTQALKLNGFQFSLNTMPDTTWRIDASTNLLSWRPVKTNTADSSGTLQFADPQATNYPRRYYRAVLP